MGEQLEVSGNVPASPAQIYAAWLDGELHAAMTGGRAEGAPMVGTRFSAWDGYINGTNLELDPGRRIVQAWRTSEFPADAPDSRLEVLLSPEGAGTRITIRQTEIPLGQAVHYQSGWHEHYLEPMMKYFGGGIPEELDEPEVAEKPAKKVPAAKKAPAAKKPAAKKAKPAKKAKKAAAKKAAPKAKAKARKPAKAKKPAKKAKRRK